MTIKDITTCPNPLNGVYNPSKEMQYAAGYREVPPLPEVLDDFTRTDLFLAEGDGVTGAWVQTVRPTADIEAEQAAADKAANLPRWCYENAFLLVCQSHFGTLEKRGTAELLKKGFEMMETGTPVAQVMGAFGLVISIDKELTRMGGDLWWDSVTWHNDADAIAGAQQILGVA